MNGVRKNQNDLTGQRFGRYTVLRKAERPAAYKSNHPYWLCRCDCGNEKLVRGDHLLSGRIVSCGCYTMEHSREVATRHGKSHSRLYPVWNLMKARCTNPNNNRYHRYGARGIKVCDEWANDFAVFYDWAIINGYDETAKRGKCTIDRIDNDGDYEPSNCRWVDMKVQANNRGHRKEVMPDGRQHYAE